MIEVILAGGLGTRFWPWSRRSHPKQFLEILGDRSMLERTVERLRTSPSHEHTFVLVDSDHLDLARARLPDAPDLDILRQPSVRDTAPAVALSTLESQRHFGDQPVGIFPADHLIDNRSRFHRALEDAAMLARDGALVTLGTPPTRPETGYGYIQYGSDSRTLEGRELSGRAHPVRRFVEKPDRSTAQRYLEEGDYLWNAGISVFRPSRLLEEMSRQMPESRDALETLERGLAQHDRAAIERAYESLEPVSLDRGVFEGADSLVVLPVECGWSDVGHWSALSELEAHDSSGNLVRGEGELLDSEETILMARDSDRTVIGVDLEGIVIVDTPDATLVLPESQSQRVREVVDRLEDEGRHDLL